MICYHPPQAGQPPVSKVSIRHGLPASTGVWSLQRQLNKRIDKLPPGKQKKAKKMPARRIASWNVRTMRPGLSNDLQQINDSRKTAIIDSELDRLNIDIATLQETRLAENGSINEQRYTFFWHGKRIEEKREHGVGFAVKNSLITVTRPPLNGSERILTIRLLPQTGRANIMRVYPPPLQNPKISSTRNWMLLLATFPKQNTCTYWEILMQECEPILIHGLHVLDTMAWGK